MYYDLMGRFYYKYPALLIFKTLNTTLYFKPTNKESLKSYKILYKNTIKGVFIYI